MIDDIDRSILRLLARYSRMSYKELAARVPLSEPHTTERVRRLEERGVIRSYSLELDPVQLGYALQAIVRICPMPGRVRTVWKLLEATPEIVECDKVMGDDCFVARLFARSMEHLDKLVERLATDATTSTIIVKGQVIDRRPPPIGPA